MMRIRNKVLKITRKGHISKKKAHDYARVEDKAWTEQTEI